MDALAAVPAACRLRRGGPTAPGTVSARKAEGFLYRTVSRWMARRSRLAAGVPPRGGGLGVLTRWHLVLSRLEEPGGIEKPIVDVTVVLPVSAASGQMNAECAAYLANEVIAQLNGLLAPEEVDAHRQLPYLGTCRGCGRVVDDQHLLGGERDICDRCWTRPAEYLP